jgi:16S rRNA (cytidine1402-2'-O)-methyltransferase
MTKQAKVFLIPSMIDETATQTIPAYVLQAVKKCEVFFVENERSARRYLKSLDKEINIDQYEWFTIHKSEETVAGSFREKIKEGKTIGIISEAGCPGVADPGQLLVQVAQDMNVSVSPLVGPSSILLALMASGMNGQQFQFVGYLPIDQGERQKKILDLENESKRKNTTQLFIETPYRNNQLLETILKTCKPATSLCIAVNITSEEESIQTKSIAQWKERIPDLNKKPALFLLLAR